ncbi:MAG: flagellin [Chloroflexi bacterium]|nr:flagellin [Chloroflexota bacterium]
MIINDNLMSLFAAQNLQNTQNDLQKVLQQLSSGLRINSAADDAAGLAIAQKMDAQVSGLDQAKRNAQDAISLIQTAGGGLSEIQAMLQRMRELAVQAASDTMTASDRQQLQNEVDQLAQEIQQIATTTQFNTQKLLDGSYQSKVFQVGANAGETLTLSIGQMTAGTLKVGGYDNGWNLSAATVSPTSAVLGGASTAATFAVVTATTDSLVGNGAYTLTVTSISATSYSVALVDSSGATVASATVAGTDTSATLTDANTNSVLTVTLGGSDTFSSVTTTEATTSVTISDASVNFVASDTTVQAGLDITSAAAASAAISTLDNAIQQVSAQQAVLGAYQNRLQHVINVNAISYENLTSAKAQIMDVDMATAMAQFTRDQILQQAGIAALAQANQVPAAVLKLLG